jgi:hypothetical protein
MATAMASSAPSSSLRQLLDEHVSSVSTEVDRLIGEARERTRRDLTEQLNAAARRMRQATDTEELAATLVDAASAFATGAAFFRIEEKIARGERIRGVPEESTDRFVGLQTPLDSAPALANAVESKDPVTAIATAREVSAELLAVASGSADTRVTIVPVLVRNTARGLLYCWGAVDAAAVELHCQIAAAVWSGIEPITVKVTEPAPQIVQIAGVEPKKARRSWESLPAEEQQVHLRAQRAARVHAAEMRLEEAAAVQAGRARRDLYGALRPRIDAARAQFKDAFFASCPSMVDYLHLELVRTLANGDTEAMGRDYPGPLV